METITKKQYNEVVRLEELKKERITKLKRLDSLENEKEWENEKNKINIWYREERESFLYFNECDNYQDGKKVLGEPQEILWRAKNIIGYIK